MGEVKSDTLEPEKNGGNGRDRVKEIVGGLLNRHEKHDMSSQSEINFENPINLMQKIISGKWESMDSLWFQNNEHLTHENRKADIPADVMKKEQAAMKNKFYNASKGAAPPQEANIPQGKGLSTCRVLFVLFLCIFVFIVVHMDS